MLMLLKKIFFNNIISQCSDCESHTKGTKTVFLTPQSLTVISSGTTKCELLQSVLLQVYSTSQRS